MKTVNIPFTVPPNLRPLRATLTGDQFMAIVLVVKGGCTIKEFADIIGKKHERARQIIQFAKRRCNHWSRKEVVLEAFPDWEFA